MELAEEIFLFAQAVQSVKEEYNIEESAEVFLFEIVFWPLEFLE